MATLTVERLIAINKLVGSDGVVVNSGNLDFISENVSHSQNPVKAAAVLLHDIISLHPFLDGNKRTAVVAMESYLELNNISIKLKDKELEKLVYEIAIGMHNKGEVESIINKSIST